MSSDNQLAVQPAASAELSMNTPAAFEHFQRVANAYANSQLVPATYQKNVANVIIAMDVAQRIGASALAVMQALNVIHGKPTFSSQFIIAAINSSRKFTPLRFIYGGTPGQDSWSCFAQAKSKEDGFECKGVTVTIEMAKKEGWHGKSGSKWQTMPELMLMYRAATFFGRMYAPEMLNGMKADDEVIDIEHIDANGNNGNPPAGEATTTTDPKADATPKRRSKADKGIASMKTAEPVPPATPSTEPVPGTPVEEPPAPKTDEIVADAKPVADTPPQESSSSKQEPAKSSDSGSASAAVTTEPSAPAPAAEPGDIDSMLLPRCEIKAVADKGGGVTEVKLEGDYTGTAYYQYVEGRAKLPAAGAIIDVKLIDKPSKNNAARTLKVIESFEVVG